jgi:hypothetical protein
MKNRAYALKHAFLYSTIPHFKNSNWQIKSSQKWLNPSKDGYILGFSLVIIEKVQTLCNLNYLAIHKLTLNIIFFFGWIFKIPQNSVSEERDDSLARSSYFNNYSIIREKDSQESLTNRFGWPLSMVKNWR